MTKCDFPETGNTRHTTNINQRRRNLNFFRDNSLENPFLAKLQFSELLLIRRKL